MTITIGYSPIYLQWTGSHASPQRAHLAVEHIKAQAGEEEIPVEILSPSTSLVRRNEDRERLKSIHSADYVDALFDGTYPGHPGNQGFVAWSMFAGTRVLVERIEKDGFASKLYFNPQGAKHHAAYDHSAGFCALNDMAWAARHWTSQGLRVAYLDWDVHHGDGVQDLTADDPNILTVSIHQGGLYPGTGLHHEPKKNVWNFPLQAGDGDGELMTAITQSLKIIEDFEPDVLLIAAGADGHESDPLGQLVYTVEGFTQAAAAVGEYVHEAQIPVLIGGAGGYQPFTYVPIIWSEVIFAIHEQLSMPIPTFELEVI